MKKLTLTASFLFLLNVILAFMLLLSYLSYFIAPDRFALIPFVSLSVPLLILVNIFFAIYWLVKLQKKCWLSVVVLLIGYPYLSKLYAVHEKKVLLTDDLTVMSYNIRMFNHYQWIKADNIDLKILDFIEEKKPDILCLQEYFNAEDRPINYPYQYVKTKSNTNHFGHAIFSKYKIIHSGSLDYSVGGNNAIFADIVTDKDTIRVYNIHLESLKIDPTKEMLGQQDRENLKIRVQRSFAKQADQARQVLEHQERTNHRTIVCGDFNNTAFSWVYNRLSKGKKDAFEVAGQGFGKTYDFIFPIRMDFILADEEIEVNNYKTYSVKYSDHYPIMARLGL